MISLYPGTASVTPRAIPISSEPPTRRLASLSAPAANKASTILRWPLPPAAMRAVMPSPYIYNSAQGCIYIMVRNPLYPYPYRSHPCQSTIPVALIHASPIHLALGLLVSPGSQKKLDEIEMAASAGRDESRNAVPLYNNAQGRINIMEMNSPLPQPLSYASTPQHFPYGLMPHPPCSWPPCQPRQPTKPRRY